MFKSQMHTIENLKNVLELYTFNSLLYFAKREYIILGVTD